MRQERQWVQVQNPVHPVLRACQHLALTWPVHAKRIALKFSSLVVTAKFEGIGA